MALRTVRPGFTYSFHSPFPVTWCLQGARHSAAAGGLAVWMAPGDPLPQPPCASPGPPSHRALSKQGLIPPPRSSGCRGDRGLANQAIARRRDRGCAGEGTGCGGPQGWPLTQVLVAWFLVSRIWSPCNLIPLYLSCQPLAHCPCAPNTYPNSHHSNQTGPIGPCGPLRHPSLQVNILSLPPTQISTSLWTHPGPHPLCRSDRGKLSLVPRPLSSSP